MLPERLRCDRADARAEEVQKNEPEGGAPVDEAPEGRPEQERREGLERRGDDMAEANDERDIWLHPGKHERREHGQRDKADARREDRAHVIRRPG